MGEAWAQERPLLLPVSRRVLARYEGGDTLVALPDGPPPAPARLEPVVETRSLVVYAELAR